MILQTCLLESIHLRVRMSINIDSGVEELKRNVMDKGSKERSPPHNLSRKTGSYTYAIRNSKMIDGLKTQTWDPIMHPRKSPRTRTTPATTTTTTTMTDAQLKAMIDQGVTAALAARDVDRSRNGDDNHTSRTGTEGVVELTQWFERMETVFRISNCTVENQIKFATYLKKKMTDKYCPRGEIKKLEVEMFPEESDKIEKYVGGLPDMIHGSVMASRPKTMQDAIEMATELMDKKISTLAERQAENKRKFDF
ncbi:hypothetical protein Tco_0503645 [Tanacetum coccineum]